MSIKSAVKIALKSKAVNAAVLTGAAIVASASPAAFASDYDAPLKVEVTVAVADLQSPTGAQSVYAKLKSAALDACRVEKAFMTERMIKTCTSDLLDQFVKDLSKAEVTALHAARDA